MASLTRAGLEPGLLAATTLHYGEEQFPVELTIDTLGEDAGFIDLAHDTRDTRSPEWISYRICLTSSRPNYGGSAIGSAALGRVSGPPSSFSRGAAIGSSVGRLTGSAMPASARRGPTGLCARRVGKGMGSSARVATPI
jgi:hypothetical protein